MFERLKNWLAPEAKPIPKPLGFFSTDAQLFNADGFDLQATLRKSIQVDPKKFRAVAQDGTVAALDASIQEVKYLNSGENGLIPNVQLDWYASQGFIGYQVAAIIAQHWLVDKACSMPAKDAVRHGYDVTINDGTDVDPKVIDFIRQRDKDFKILKNCTEFVHMGRVFGIRVALYRVESNDKDYYLKPFNPDGIKPGSYKGITQIDPYWITPELDISAAADPSAPDFYEPTWWRINGKRVHRTHLAIFRNGYLADILKPTYLYGGVPVPQKVAERVYAAERTANEAPMLAMSKRMTVINVDMTQATANQVAFEQKMQVWSSFMNNYGVKVVGEAETIEQFDTSLTDLDAVIMTQYQIVAAAANVPATKLLGTTPKGFNSTGDYEESSYHEELESIQENDLNKLVDGHHIRLIRSEVAPKFGIKPFTTTTNWKPVNSPSAEELADLNAKKADTDMKLVQAGAVDGFDVRQRIIADPDSGYSGIPDIVDGGPGDRDAQQEAEAALEQPVTAKSKETKDQ